MTRPDQTNYDFLYDKQYYAKTLLINQNPIRDKELGFRIIRDCYAMPFPYSVEDGSGLFDSEGVYVKGSSLWHGGVYTASYASLSDIARERSIDLSRVPHKNQRVIFAGTLLSVWGHFITDCTRLLWFLRSQERAEKFSDCPVIYLSDPDFAMKGNYKRFLELMGIDTSVFVPVTELTFFEEVILPDECFFAHVDGPRFFTREYAGMIDAVRNCTATNARPSASEKVYFSYSQHKNGKVFGEDKLEKYFATKGYRIIHPQTLTLDEQLNVLANARSFASTVGSCSHNVIFLPEGAEVILIPRVQALNEYQLALNNVRRFNVYYVDSSFSIFARTQGTGSLLYFISSKLREFFHDEDTQCIVSASDFRRYSHSFAKADNPDAYRYYSAVAAEYFGKLFAMSWRGKMMRLKESLKQMRVLRDFVRKVRRIIRRK